MAKRGPQPRVQTQTAARVTAPDVVEIPLHEVQSAYCKSKAIYCAFTGGVGAGKSFVLAYDGCVNTEPGAPIAIVAATYRMLEDTSLRSFKEIASKLGLWNQDRYRRTDNIAVLNNGIEVFFRSGDDPDKLSGLNLSRVLLDEASLMKEMVFTISVARLRWQGRQGQLRAAFTPRGKEHWTYRLFADETNPNVELFRCSTKHNPFVGPEFYENLLRQYGLGEGGQLRALQDLEGEFVTVEGSEWGPECFAPSLWFDEWPNDPEATRAVALDASKGKSSRGDYSSFAKGMYSGGRVWLEFDIDNQRNASAIAQRCVDIHADFNPHYFGIEQEFGGDVLADDIELRANARNMIVPLVLVPTGGVQKEERIHRLTPYMTRGLFRFRNTPMTRRAVAMLESWPFGEWDDVPDSLEMLVRIFNESMAVIS